MAKQTQYQTDFMAGRDLACELFNRAMELDRTDQAELSNQYRDGRAQVDFVTSFLEVLRNKPELADGFAATLSCGLVHGIACVDIGGMLAVTYPQIFGPYQWPANEDGEPVTNVLAFKRDEAPMSELSDQFHITLTSAKTFTHMLSDLTGEDDNISDGLGPNDPASRIQRIYACIEALQGRLEALREIEEAARRGESQ